jgi:hypothetical protein
MEGPWSNSCCPPPESGPTFTTKWRRAGKKTVTATCGGTTKTAKVRVLDVLIDINKTRATNDDIVQVKCNHPERRFEVPCTIRLSKDSKNLATGPVKLVLTDPTGRLRFPGEFDFTRTVDLPANGDPVTFHITGQQASEKKGDAEIEARLNTATGPIVKKKNVTVFTFDNAKMGVTEGGNYTLKDGLYFVPDDVAVSFKATATLTPPGLHCRAPQIRDLRVAIMQEISFFFARIEFGSPNFVPEPEVHGETASFATTIWYDLIFDAPLPINDGLEGAAPLYDKDRAAVKPPRGCPRAGSASSDDSPAITLPTFAWPLFNQQGAKIGTVTWTAVNYITSDEQFRTFCVVFNRVTKEVVCALREATWSLQLDSRQQDQHARA